MCKSLHQHFFQLGLQLVLFIASASVHLKCNTLSVYLMVNKSTGNEWKNLSKLMNVVKSSV